MAKKLTPEDFKNIKGKVFGESKYKVLNVDDGEVDIEFLSTIYLVEPGDEDLLGNIWGNKESQNWTKHEAKVLFNGKEKVLSFGGINSALINTFKARCLENNLQPDDLPGTKWKFKKLSPIKYEITYLGKKETVQKKEKKVENKSDDEIGTIVNAIEDLKSDSNIAEKGISREEFVKVIAIKGNIPTEKVQSHLQTLFDKKIITYNFSEDKIYLN